MLDKILGKKDKDKNDTPDLRKSGKKSDSDNSDIGGRLKDMVGKVSGKPKDNGNSKTYNSSKLAAVDENDTPDLRKSGKKSDSDNSDIGGRLKDMVGKVSGKPKDNDAAKNDKDDKKGPNDKKIPRPMPKPKPKQQPLDKPRLRPPEKKKPGGFAGLGGGLGKQLPEDDQRTLVGAAVFGIILIILVGAGYYFLVYAPYQDTLNSAKMTKINEVNTYFKGALANAPQKNILLADIDSSVTPDQVLAVDVIGPATTDWQNYQNQQINLKKDPYNRVQISYSVPANATDANGNALSDANNVKNLIMNVTSAQTIINQADASVLSNMGITTPDTVAIPVLISRLQAAGGLINVGDSVDVYQNVNATPPAASGNASNNTTAPTTQPTTTTSSPVISGVSVLAILRDTTSSSDYNANMSKAQEFSINGAGLGTESSQTASGTVEQVLQAGASRNWNEAQMDSLLNAYGYRLSNFERVSNLGNMNANYLVVLEVPRENALWVIQNNNYLAGSSLYLVVPTQKAPVWMVQELQQIYG